MDEETDLKAIRRNMDRFWMVLKWGIILAITALIFLYFAGKIADIDRMSDFLEK